MDPLKNELVWKDCLGPMKIAILTTTTSVLTSLIPHPCQSAVPVSCPCRPRVNSPNWTCLSGLGPKGVTPESERQKKETFVQVEIVQAEA